MTTFTIRLKTDSPVSRNVAYELYGHIALALAGMGQHAISLIDITDDVAPPTSSPSKPARKPRGPNKAKIITAAEFKASQAEVAGSIERLAADPDMPTFLKRERE